MNNFHGSVNASCAHGLSIESGQGVTGSHIPEVEDAFDPDFFREDDIDFSLYLIHSIIIGVRDLNSEKVSAGPEGMRDIKPEGTEIAFVFTVVLEDGTVEPYFGKVIHTFEQEFHMFGESAMKPGFRNMEIDPKPDRFKERGQSRVLSTKVTGDLHLSPT